MPKPTTRIGRAAQRAVEEIELRAMAAEGRRSVKAKVARVKRVTRKALKAGMIAGAVVATAVVMRERKKQRKLDA